MAETKYLKTPKAKSLSKWQNQQYCNCHKEFISSIYKEPLQIHETKD